MVVEDQNVNFDQTRVDTVDVLIYVSWTGSSKKKSYVTFSSLRHFLLVPLCLTSDILSRDVPIYRLKMLVDVLCSHATPSWSGGRAAAGPHSIQWMFPERVRLSISHK